MTIGFLTQYYRGLGHSQRIKFIAEKTAEHCDVVVMDQLFDPPMSTQFRILHFFVTMKFPI